MWGSLQLLILWLDGWAGCMGSCDWSGNENNAQDLEVLACDGNPCFVLFIFYYYFFL